MMKIDIHIYMTESIPSEVFRQINPVWTGEQQFFEELGRILSGEAFDA